MIRCVALFLAVVFTMTTLVGSPSEAYAAAGAFELLGRNNNGMTQLRQGLNAIPSEWGTVNSFWQPAENKSGNIFIVHIQDAHSNPEAAQNIASILGYLSKKHPSMVIGLEGAAGALHSEYMDFFKDYPDANLAVINDLKQKGELNGAELFLLGKNRTPERETQVGNINLEYGPLSGLKQPQVQGLETPELYRDDLRIYQDLLSKRGEVEAFLNPIRAKLEKESSKQLNGELRDFLKERSRRKEGRFGLGSQADPNLQAYATYLHKQVLKNLGIDLTDRIEQLRFPNLVRVLQVIETQKKFDSSKARTEWAEVLKALSVLAKETSEQDFVAALTTFARQQGFVDAISGRDFSYPIERALYPRKLLEGLFLFKQKHPVDLARYETFLKSWELVAFQSEIEVTELFKEMSVLEDQVLLVLTKNKAEKKLVKQIAQLDLLEKLLHLELSRAEYDEVLASREAIKALNGDQKSLAPLLEQAFHFYEVSLKRDHALVENLLALLPQGDEKPRIAVLYSGGFHSSGIEEILRSKGIGYAEIAPKIRAVDRGELYQRVMAGDNADLTAYFKVRNPFSTKQEALFFKQLIETAAPVLFEKYQLTPHQVAGSVAQAMDVHPILSKVVVAERPAGDKGSAVTFQTKPEAPVQATNSAVMPEALLGNEMPLADGVARSEVRTTVEFGAPQVSRDEIRPESEKSLPLPNKFAQAMSQRRAEIRFTTEEALREILRKPGDAAEVMQELYEEGSLLAPEFRPVFSEFGIDPSRLDLGIEAAGDKVIRRELKTKNLKLYRAGSETNVYRGTVNGNDILVKEIRLDSATADSVWENHLVNQEKLGGLVANYITIKDLEVRVEGEERTIHYAIVQEFATPLLDRVARIQDEKENVEDKAEEIDALMKAYLDLYPEFLKRGFVPKPNGFLVDMGRTEDGRIVALDIGDLLPAESPDGVTLLKMIESSDNFSGLLLACSFMSNFVAGVGDEAAQIAKDPIMSGREGQPRSGVLAMRHEATSLSKNTTGYSLLIDPREMFGFGGKKDLKTYAFSERIEKGLFPKGIRESLSTDHSVYRTTYLGDVNIRGAIRDERLRYVRSFFRTREMSRVGESDAFKLVLVDPKDIEPNVVLEGNPTGMGMTEGEIVYFDPAQKRIDRSIVRPHDSAEDQRMKLDNEIAAFRIALQTIDGQIEPETRALWGHFQREIEEAIRIKKERGEYAVGTLILRERQKIEKTTHPLEAQNLREALFVLEKSLLPLLEDREAFTYLSFENSQSSEELSKRLMEHEDRRAVVKVLQILLKLPYGFSAPSEAAQKDERTWATGVQLAVGELLGDMRSMIRQNRSAKRAAKVMISSDHKIAKQIQANKEQLKAKPNDKTANRTLTTYEALKEIFETVQQDLSEYDYVFDETDTPEARTGKIGDNLLVHQAVKKAVFARTAFQLPPEMEHRFDSYMMKEITKGRTLQYAVAAFLYTSFVEKNMMVFFDQKLMNYLMAYYHFSVLGKTSQTPDKNIIVVASSIRNETEYAALLREAGIYGKVVAIGTLDVGYEVSGKNRFPHWYIFARQSGIVPIFPIHPAVPKSREIKISNGGWAMVDGQRGQMIQNPDKKTAENWRKRGEGYRHMKLFFENRAALPVAFNNKPFFYRYDAVNANLFRPQPGGAVAARLGGKGIGLYRMEAQLSDSKNPGVEENEEFISAPIKDILGQDYFNAPENALIVRLYDVQDDKRPVMLRENRDYQEIEAILADHSNVRFYIYSDEELAKSPGLAQFREFGKHQLRALFDAKRTHPDRILKILFSNVREPGEIDEIEKLVREAREDYLRQVSDDERPRVAALLETVPLGYMIEETETVDRLVSIFEKIKEVSAPKNKDAVPFIAIGSNDLVKSILNQHQKKFGNEWNLSNIHPQFAADLFRIGNLAKKYGFNVNLEGEWAGSRRVLLLLLALHHFYGLDNVIPVAEPLDVPKLLEYVRNTTPEDLEKGGWLRASFQKILKKVIDGDEAIPSLTLNRALYELQHKIEQRIFQREDFKAFMATAEAGTGKIRSEMRRVQEAGAMSGLAGAAASFRRSEMRAVGFFAKLIGKYSPEAGVAFFVRFAQPGGSMLLQTLKPIEEEWSIQNLLVFNRTGREFSIGQKPGTHVYEIVAGHNYVDAIFPDFADGFEFIGHTHPPKQGEPSFLPSHLDLYYVSSNYASREESWHFILSSFGMTRYTVERGIDVADENRREYDAFYKAMRSKTPEQITAAQMEILKKRGGIQLEFSTRPPKGRSEVRSEARDRDLEAVLQLPLVPGLYQSQRSIEAGNATEEILRKESLSREIVKHAFGRQSSQRLEIFPQSILIEATHNLEEDIRKFDLDRVLTGIDLMDRGSVRDEENILTGTTMMAGVPVTLTLDLTNLRAIMAHGIRIVGVSDETSDHRVFKYSLAVGGTERFMLERAIERVLSGKDSGRRSEMRDLGKHPVFLGGFKDSDYLARGNPGVLPMLEDFFNHDGLTTASELVDLKSPPAVAVLRFNSESTKSNIQALKALNPDVKIILVTGDWMVALSKEELQAIGADRLLYLGSGPSDLRDAVLEYIQSSKPVPVSGAKAREYTNRDRMANLLRHDLSGKLGILFSAEDAAHDSKTRLEEAVREILVVFRIFDPEQFKARGGELFIPEGNSDIFAYSIPSARSSKVYQTGTYGTMPRARTLDDAALRQLADELGFDEIRNYFSKEIGALEGLRDELLKPGPLTPGLRSRIVRVAHDILTKRNGMFGRWTAQATPAVAVSTKQIEKILIVDDEAMLLGLLKMQLQTLKNEDGKRYVVTSAKDGEEALSILAPKTPEGELDERNAAKFDLVITDLTMPKMGGMQLIREMIRNGITPPVIVFSGYAAGDIENGLKEFRKTGLNVDFLSKPFTIEDLNNAIKKMSTRSESREDAGLGQVAVAPKKIEQVLVVDDDPSSLMVINALVQKFTNEDNVHYVVSTATDGQEALRRLEDKNAKKIDLVITDVNMPRLSGTELMKALAQEGMIVPVIFSTSYAAGDITKPVEELKMAGINVGFLQKPITSLSVKAALEKISGRSESREDNLREPVAVPANKIEQVLVVDDVEASRMIMKMQLAKLTNEDNAHYVVSVAADGHEALRRLADQNAKKIDLVITDLTMPEMGGTELINAMIKEGIRASVLIGTAHSLEDVAKPLEEFRKAGLNVGFLGKPITLKNLKAALEKISGRSESRKLEIRALEKRVQSAQATLIHPYDKGQRLIGENALDVRLDDLSAKKGYIRSKQAFGVYGSLRSVLKRMYGKAATGDVSLNDIGEAYELVGRLVAPPKFSGDKLSAKFLASLERVQQDLERWGKAKLDQREAQIALDMLNSPEKAGESWVKALNEAADRYKNKPNFYNLVKSRIVPAVENWVKEPRSPEQLAEVRKNGLSILEKWHKFKRQSDGRLQDNHLSPNSKEDGLGSKLRMELFVLWEELDIMVRTVEPSAPRSSLAVRPGPAMAEPVKEEAAKKIVAAPSVEPKPIQLELFPRSEVRMPSTADFKQSELKTVTAFPELSVQADVLTAVKDAGQTISNIQSPAGLAFFMKDGPTSDNIEKAKLVIAHWLVQGLVAEQGEREISNKELRDQIEVLVKAAGKQIPAWKAPEDTFRKGAVVHSDLTFLDAAALEKLVADYFAVILGTLVRLDEKLVIHIDGSRIDAEKIKDLNAQVQKLAVANGIPLADRLQIVALDERVFKNLKADAVLASEEGLKRITANRHLKSLWKLTDKAIGDTRLLAGDMATVLLAMLDPNIGLSQKEYSPESYSKEMLNTVLDALKAYESIKQAA